jgi:hypothetical protein
MTSDALPEWTATVIPPRCGRGSSAVATAREALDRHRRATATSAFLVVVRDQA